MSEVDWMRPGIWFICLVMSLYVDVYFLDVQNNLFFREAFRNGSLTPDGMRRIFNLVRSDCYVFCHIFTLMCIDLMMLGC